MFESGGSLRKMPAATAAQFFVKAGAEDAAENFREWERIVSADIERMGGNSAAFHASIYENNESILLFAGSLMATSLLAPRNIFEPTVAQAIYANVDHELSASKQRWFGWFVMNLLAQAQAKPAPAFMPFALIKELDIKRRDPELDRLLTGPIFLSVLGAYELAFPIVSFWKSLSETVTIVA